MTRRTPKNKLTLYRRHAEKCPHADEMLGDKCECLIWCHGRVSGKFIRKSLDTRSLSVAEMKKRDLLNPLPPTPEGNGPRLVGSSTPGEDVTLEWAHDQFQEAKKGSSVRTRESCRRHIGQFRVFAEAHGVIALRHVTPDLIEAYFKERSQWKLTTKVGVLDYLRVFFNFCVDKDWLLVSPAAKKRLSFKRRAPQLRKPFTPAEIKKILQAIRKLPADKQPVARAIILLMLCSGMRISDATFCERSSLDAKGMLNYCSIKTHHFLETAVWLRKEAAKALAALPKSRVYYFQPDREDDYWDCRQALKSGEGQKFADLFPGGPKAYVSRIDEMEGIVYRVLVHAGIRRPKMTEARENRARKTAGNVGLCHRFRDTFAVNLLTAECDIYTVAIFLGHSDVKLTKKHYLKLVPGYQEKISKKTMLLNYPLHAA